jgi:hypothetical protein
MRAQVQDVPIFGDMFGRLLEHLAANEIDVDARTVTLGPWLEVDRENERFRDNEQANRLVRGFYREPYVVPDLSGWVQCRNAAVRAQCQNTAVRPSSGAVEDSAQLLENGSPT